MSGKGGESQASSPDPRGPSSVPSKVPVTWHRPALSLSSQAGLPWSRLCSVATKSFGLHTCVRGVLLYVAGLHYVLSTP